MISGNSVIFQTGKETTYGTAATGTKQDKISSESLKPVYNKIDEGLATGGRGAGLKATMGIGVEGSFSTLMRPDMAYWLKYLLGVESVDEATEGYTHTFTAIESGESYHLPSFTAYVDRKVKKCKYTGCKVNSATLSASAGDYLKLDVTVNGKDEVYADSLASLTPSSLRAFKFAQAKLYTGSYDSNTGTFTGTELADVKEFSLEWNNNLDAQTQTTSTGAYYKEPEVNTREATIQTSLIYATAAETVREAYYKSDATLGLKIELISDEMIEEEEPYKMTIIIPCVQCSDADANMGDPNSSISQNMTFDLVDNLVDELIIINVDNGDSSAY